MTHEESVKRLAYAFKDFHCHLIDEEIKGLKMRRKTALEIAGTVWFHKECPDCEEAQYWTVDW